MKEYKGWTDVLVRKRKNGEFVLYRNYIDLNGDYFFSRFEEVQDSKNESLYKQKPVAIGITAFFGEDFDGVKCLRKRIETHTHFRTHEVFQTYLNFFLAHLKSENEKAVKPSNEDVIVKNFLGDHLNNEKLKFSSSKTYFKEVLSRRDRIIKNYVQEYIKGYFYWIEEQITLLNKKLSSQNKKDTRINQNLKLSDVLVKSVKPEAVKDLYFESRGEDDSTKYLTMFLRHLKDKGYYKRKLTLNELQFIGINDFSKSFKLHRKYIPPKKNTTAYDSFPYNKIPQA